MVQLSHMGQQDNELCVRERCMSFGTAPPTTRTLHKQADEWLAMNTTIAKEARRPNEWIAYKQTTIKSASMPEWIKSASTPHVIKSASMLQKRIKSACRPTASVLRDPEGLHSRRRMMSHESSRRPRRKNKVGVHAASYQVGAYAASYQVGAYAARNQVGVYAASD